MIHSVAFYDMQAHSPRILKFAPRDRAWLLIYCCDYCICGFCYCGYCYHSHGDCYYCFGYCCCVYCCGYCYCGNWLWLLTMATDCGYCYHCQGGCYYCCDYYCCRDDYYHCLLLL